MAGGNTYGVGTVTVDETTVTDIVGLRLGKKGTMQGFGSDGDSWQKKRWIEDRYIDGDFETIDINIALDFEAGQLCEISFVFRPRLTGVDYDEDNNILANITNAVIEPFDGMAKHSGVSGSTVPFSAPSVDGSESPLSWGTE